MMESERMTMKRQKVDDAIQTFCAFVALLLFYVAHLLRHCSLCRREISWRISRIHFTHCHIEKGGRGGGEGRGKNEWMNEMEGISKSNHGYQRKNTLITPLSIAFRRRIALFSSWPRSWRRSVWARNCSNSAVKRARRCEGSIAGFSSGNSV